MVAPSLQPAGLPAYMGGVVGAGGAVDPGALQQLKLIQIRKPLLKSSMVDSNMSEEEVNMNYVQDLLSWVEEMQVQLDRGEWGSDLPSVETHLENHKSMHRAIEEFQMSLKEAKHSEIQMTSPMKQNYSEKLGNLETHYGKLLNTSKTRQKNLESLHDLVSRATQELIWLNEKEEEEVAFDWSDRNTNISKKRDYHADLMRELDDKEGAIRSVQDRAEQLLGGNHPARLTIEAYRAAMQTQWSWILQLCGCVEQHLRENAVYFEFFSDAKDAQDYLKGLQDTIQRKYGCDRSSSLHRLEDLVQESMDEKEQLLQYRSIVAGLVGRAKSIVQLKPRSSDHPVRTSIPVRAICDYRQIEITIYKEDECVLANNSHRAKWKVISPSGNEAMVPSVCFTVPPPNKEAVELASRIEQLYQNVLALWHHSHINMKSVVSWHYLMTDIKAIRSASVSSAKTLLPGEHQLVLSNLQSHLECFLEDSDESEVFSMADRTQLEREVDACREYYEELLRSAEREEHEESVYNIFISELRTFRMRLEGYEERLLRQIRTPLDRDDLEESMRRIVDQEAMQNELDRLKEDLEALKEKCEAFVSQASASLLAPTLSSELSVLLHSMSQVYSMSSVYLEKLKSVSLVVKHSQVAESLVKLYEAKLCEEDGVCADGKTIETVMSMLKQWRSEIDEKREVFHDLEDELQKARAISDRMFKTHNERDFDLDWHKEKADQLSERWHSVHAQIESRLRDLEGIGKSLKYYRDAYGSLDEWVREMEANQRSMQENQPEDSKALAELLNQQKVLVSEIEQKHGRIEECQKYSEQYSAAVKDYELQLMTYRAMVDSQHKSPIKRRRMQSSSDAIQQEFMDLRTRYTALVTLMTQYVKFASETLKRTEEEEKSIEEEKKEHGDKVSKLLGWMSSVKTSLSKEDKCLTDGKHSPESASKPQISMEELATKKEQIAEALRTTQLLLTKHSDKMTENEKQEAKEQLKSLHQAYSELSQQCADQTPTAQQEYQTIEGVLEVESGKVYSVCRSVQGGLIDQTTGLSLLEAQLITSGLILPEFRMCLDLDDAFKHNLVDEPTYWQLQDLNEAHKCIVGERFASEPLPVIAALREGAVSERLAMKVIEIQLATGGLRLTYTGDVLNLEKAFQCGLIPASLFIRILERQNNWKDLIDPNTAEKVSLVQLVQRSLVHEETGLRLLPVKKGREGTISLKSGREISILRAVHEGLIDRETMFRLLGAQLFAGGIVDPKTGRKLTVEEALAEGLIDQDTASGVLSHQAQNGGIVNPRNGERLTVDEAVQCDLMSSSSALLVLERQKGFMGLVWPQSGEILTVTASLQHEIITEQFAYKLLSNRQKMAAFYIPENSEVIDIDSAAKEGYIDRYTADVLKTIEIPDVFPDIDELNLRFSTWLSLRELQIEGSHRSVEDLAIDEKCINSPSPTEAKQLFISYLMMNSYMDPKSGQRLLIFDGQLNKITQLFMERIVDSGHDPEHDTSSCATSSFIDIPLNEDDVEKADSENLHFDRCTEGAEHQHRKDVERVPEDQCAKTFLSEGYHVHGKEYEADENKERSQTSCKIAGKRKSGEKKSVRFDFELNIPPESWLEKHEGRISPPDQITHGLEDETSGDSVDSYLHPKGSNAASRPTRPVVRNVTSPPLNMEISSGTDSSMVSGDRVSSDPNPQPSSVSQDLMSTKDTTEITTLPVKSRQTTENRAEGLHPEGLWWDKEERENAVLLLKSQIEEGGILDVTSGKRYDLDAALEKGLVDEEIAFEVLSSQFPEQAVSSEQPAGTILTLREASAMRSISPLTALRIMERQNLLGGFYDSESGSTISISEALEQGFLTDDLAEKVLNSPPVQGDIIGSDGSPISRRAEAINLKPSENVTAQRLLEDQTVSDGQAGNKLGGKKVATMTFDLTDGKLGENRTETQGEGREKDLSLLGNTKQLSEFLDSSPSLAPISHRSVDIQMVPSLEIEGGPIYKVANSSVPDKEYRRQGCTDVSLLGEDAGRHAVIDKSLSGEDYSRQGLTDTSLSSEYVCGKGFINVDLSDEHGRQGIVNVSSSAKDTNGQSFSDVSLSDIDAGRQTVIDVNFSDEDGHKQDFTDVSLSGKDAGKQAVIDKSLPGKDAGRQAVIGVSLPGKDAGRQAVVDKSLSGKDAGRQAVVDKSLSVKDAGRQAVVGVSLPGKDAGRQAVVDVSLSDKDAGRQAVVDMSLSDKDAGRQAVVDVSLSDKDADRQAVVDVSLSGKDSGRQAVVDKSLSGKDAGRQAVVDVSFSGEDGRKQDFTDVSLSEKDAGRQAVVDSLSGKDAGRHAEVDVSLCGEDANRQAVVDVSLSGKDTGRQAVVDVSLSDKDAGRQAVVDVSLSDKDAGRQAVVDVSFLSEDPSRQDIHVSSDGKDSSGQNVVDGSFESRSSICEDIVSDKSSDLLSLSHKEVSKEGNEPLRQPATDNCSLSTTSCPSPKPVSIMSSDRQAAIAHLGPDKNESLVQRDLMPNLPNSEKKAECFPKAVDKHDVLRDESEPIINAPPSLGSVGQINCLVTGGKGYDHPAETSSKSINLFLPPENVVSAQQRLNIEEEFSAAGLSRDTAFCEKGQNQREDTWQEEICLIGSIKDDQSERHKNGIQLERSHNTGKGQLSLEQNVFEERSVRTSSLTWPSEPSMSNLHEADMSCTTDSGHNGSKRKESFMEYIPPKFAHVPECHQRESPRATPLACEQPQISPAGTCEGEMHKMTGFKPDSGGFEGSAGGISGSVSETTKPSDVMVSQRNVPVPPPPALYSALRDRLDQLVMMKVEGVHGDSLRQVEMQALEDIMGMVQNVPEEQFQNLGSVGDTGTAVQKKDLPPRHIDSTSPDLLIDLLKQESQRSDTRKQLGGQGEGEESFEVKHTEGNLPADVQQIQRQLLQIVQLISSAGDPAILKDALRNLGGILGSDSSENQSQKTKGAEKGDAVCAAEGGGDPGSHLDQQVELTSHPQTQDANTEDLNSGESQSKPQYTTQNYLECVGRLQDHADLIEEMKNDLEAQCLLSNGIEGLQSQLEENKAHLELSYQDLLGCLQEVSAYVYDISETVSSLDITNTDDLDTVKHRIEQNKEMEKGLSHTQHQLENTAFEVQYFISEHAQTLSPAHSKQLLLALTATQRAFRELTEKVSTQRSTLELHLEIREEQRQQKSAVEKQREYSEKLQELCDSLTQTENRLIGHQQLVSGGGRTCSSTRRSTRPCRRMSRPMPMP
ncbi:hypothetical protein ANANG_G00299700 [Anguilla anguilla]|uniref:SH3 domain-containing protein n=1 Tax=Anguilla anguilla TaxID=7936 RepID=A0A9D3RI77_ANGAN|nr:hypothetical protein ANANG_G00299700 [Anguilla anguilla]